MGGRRLTAILAADIASYSAMMGADEISTVADLKGHQSVILPLIAGFSGKVIDTAGDGVLAEFASVLNAVKCAVAIQEMMRERNASVPPDRRMQFRIGINQGDVLFDDNRIYGDGINIAARLEGICEPGEICISGKVYDEIKGRFDIHYENLGARNLKNIADPVRTYRISISGEPAPRHSQAVASSSWLTRDRWKAAGAAVVLLLFAVGAGWWFLGPGRMDQTNLAPGPTVKNIPPSGQPTASAARSSDPTKVGEADAFDGMWEFTTTGGEFCPLKSFKFRRKFQDGIILSGEGFKIGSINRDGSFQFANPSPANPSITVRSRGTITGDTGEGVFGGIGTPCQGTYQIRLIGRL